MHYGVKILGETPKVIQKMYLEAFEAHEIATRRLNRQYYAGMFLIWLMFSGALYLLAH